MKITVCTHVAILGPTLLLSACHPKIGPQQSGSGAATQSVSPAAKLDGLADDLWERQMQRFPTWATFIGDRRFDDRLSDVSAQSIRAWGQELASILERLTAIPLDTLDEERRITALTLRSSLRSRLAQQEVCRQHLWHVSPLNGHPTELAQLGSFQRIDSKESARRYLRRLQAIPRLLKQHRENLRQGLEGGWSAPAVVVQRVLEQLSGLLQKPVEESPYLRAPKRASGLSEVALDGFRLEVQALVGEKIRPALESYRAFLKDTYLPRARRAIGVVSNPQGDACYKILIAHHTGETRDAREIHQVGLDELARLHGLMNELAQSQGFEDRKAFVAHLTADEKQYVADSDALVAHNQRLVARAEAVLPRAFGLLPDISVEVTPIEAYRAADAPAAYYYSAPDDRTRPAYYYINTHQTEKRPLYNMEALAYHEAVPGHHLQIAIAQTLKDLPMVRRHSKFTAYVEGWALYAETVAEELGLYSSSATRMGMLGYQAWRAARLVVDTGMHALGWSRERAIDFMFESLNLPKQEVVNEIDRYIIWPGQALAYMLGRMRIQKLRAEAETQLGAGFDLRDFHDVVLGHGAVPMPVLDQIVSRWVLAQGKLLGTRSVPGIP